MNSVVERLILIVDGASDVAEILGGLPRGAALVQVRAKDGSGRVLFDRCVAARDACRAAGARIVVNDRADVALAAGLDGVHLPENGFAVADARRLLGPAALVGASTHTVARAAEQAAAGADYVTIGPVWATPGKTAMGLGLVTAAAAAVVRAKVFALGGVTDARRAADAVRAGAWGVATIRGAHHAAALLAGVTS